MRNEGTGKMRKLLVMAVLALVVPASALAEFSGDRFFKGPVAGGVNNALVEFRAHFKNGRATKIEHFDWANVPTQCQSGSSSIAGKTSFTMKVDNKGQFDGSGDVPATNSTVKVTGDFDKKFKEASGSLRVKGSGAGCANGDTGKLHWTAEH
jgi:hypothetical protein